jgi:hypothetical protein
MTRGGFKLMSREKGYKRSPFPASSPQKCSLPLTLLVDFTNNLSWADGLQWYSAPHL